MANAQQLFYATRPFGYGEVQLTRGQTTTLLGACNDDKLKRLGYLRLYGGLKKDLCECPECGAKLIGMNERAAHVETLHPKRQLTPEQEDRHLDRQHQIADEVSPLKVGG